MSPISRLACFIVTVVCALPVSAQPPPPPIIDMHLHALEVDAQGPPPMGMCTGRIEGFPAMEPGRPYPESFMEVFKKPPCESRFGHRRRRAS